MTTSQYISGLERSRVWWMLDVAPALESKVPDLYHYIAAGLVGDGSDCFGYDDAISADHDSHTRVKIWIPGGVGGGGAAYRIRDAVGVNPEEDEITTGPQSVEVYEVSQFYQHYTGLEFSPRTWREWYSIPQHNLAAATNGEVFFDGGGRFTQRREILLSYYPLDVCLKFLESAALNMGQAGQYNYPRLLSRGEIVAADIAKAIFVRNLLLAVFILNKRYMPFYKWAHRAVKDLPILGTTVADALERMVGARNAVEDIEMLSYAIISELQRQGLSTNTDDFLVRQAITLREQIIEPELREENPWKI